MSRYTLLLERDPDDGTYTVTVPALPGIVTQGTDLEDAIAMGRDAIRCHVSGLLADGLPVPEEAERPQLITLDVDVPTLVIHGSIDELNPTANAHLLAERIPGAELHIVTSGRHGFFEEFREKSSRAVLGFLRRHPLRAEVR